MEACAATRIVDDSSFASHLHMISKVRNLIKVVQACAPRSLLNCGFGGDSMTRTKLLVAANLFFFLVVSAALATQEPFRVRSVFTAQPGDVSVVVELPPGLTPQAAEFALVIDNDTVTAREVRGQDIAVMLLVDISGSIKRGPLNDIKKALLSFSDKIRPQDQFALTTFADDDKVVSPFKETRDNLRRAIQKLDITEKNTKFYRALYNALGNLQDSDRQRRTIFIVISDGKDEGSTEPLQEVIARSKNSAVPIYTLFHGETDVLRDLAEATGGKFYPAQNAAEIRAALEKIYELETRSFLVRFTYDADASRKTADKAAIELQRAAGSPLKDGILQKIPLVASRTPPPVTTEIKDRPRPFLRWLLWCLSAGLLVGVALLAGRRSQRKDETPIRPKERERGEPMVIPEAEPEPEGRTRIGHYFPVPAAGHPTATLIGISGAVKGQEFSVEREVFHIGASAENDLSIAQDAYVSADHAYLRFEKGSLFIFDRTSRNGTFVNDNQVTDTGHVLRPGDLIRLGESTFKVVTPTS